MVKQPKISIVLLTLNRKEMLRDNLTNIFLQQYADKEIIVVDNGSNDGTSEMVTELFPDTILITLENNIGITGRNIGIKKAKGEFVVVLDDDVFFALDDELENIITFFKENDHAAALAFKILDIDNSVLELNWYHPRDIVSFSNTTFVTDYIPEGAVAFRKEILDKVGLYPESFFISHEGPDLAYRIIDSGYNIYYFPLLSVHHKCNKTGKTDWRYAYYDTRNHIWLAVRNLPVIRASKYIIYRMMTTYIFCFKQNKMKWYFKAIYDGLKGIPGEIKYRKPISTTTINKLKDIRKYDKGIFEKCRRHSRRHKELFNKYGNYK